MTGLPEDLVASSFGCGNPTALIDLQPGEVVLDLGKRFNNKRLYQGKKVSYL
ncbi:hypothetical protein DESHY_110026 [Desulforamulus hydrothermalis Lam5 = DSM 18033]|uniref:Uncharacterized protein n=1 Tax=Desulforamulus hydrothermalis Lam5 = DSM 18033 TaxID=1121428 RepID=K8DX20_9FIRM|nr:hypothetical protein DESHY_110026 [Desulforamulus hydrothermalis Lam5 = DSM 18033]SHH40871.1 hypothetical protein SAMN02745177_02457 [Desulforamulus hydrothermalis Lam5 = DSM 18033]